jgi:hypothetical protein
LLTYAIEVVSCRKKEANILECGPSPFHVLIWIHKRDFHSFVR